jgi:hypothetical protein
MKPTVKKLSRVNSYGNPVYSVTTSEGLMIGTVEKYDERTPKMSGRVAYAYEVSTRWRAIASYTIVGHAKTRGVTLRPSGHFRTRQNAVNDLLDTYGRYFDRAAFFAADAPKVEAAPTLAVLYAANV